MRWARSLMKLKRAWLALTATLIASCIACSRDATAPPRGEDQGEDQGGEIDPRDQRALERCEADQIVACLGENTPNVERCAPDGQEVIASICPGGDQVCRQGACVQVACIPGSRRCAMSQGSRPEQCDEAGERYVELEACAGGAQCEQGFCLDRCEFARRERSYIGCEYWAVELENHLLYDGEIGPEELPPFGVVIANTSQQYDALITVFDDVDTIASAVGERKVGLDRFDPELVEQRVFSEVVDAGGRQLYAIDDGPIQDLVLPRGSLMTLLLPHKRVPFGQSAVGRFGYKVTSSQPVVAYQFNPLCCNYNTTNDASLLLPESALTSDYMFLGYAMFAGNAISRLDEPWSATLTIVATEPDTEVTITLPPPRGAGRPYSELFYPELNAPGEPERLEGPTSRGELSVRLDEFEVFNLGGAGVAPVEDLTGARIVSSAPVAVFSGHSCAYVPYTLGFCDHIESQLFPLETWGRSFVLAPLKRRNPDAAAVTREATYWKFVARQDDTRILFGADLTHGPQGTLRPADEGVPSCVEFSQDPTLGIVRLDRGQSCEFGARTMMLAQSNHPISVGAFLSGQDSVFEDAKPGDRAGDPAFFMVPPQEQYRSEYAFLTPKTYFQNYVTVTMQSGFEVDLNGRTVALTEFDHEELEAAGLIRAHIPLDEGPQRLSAPLPFGIVVYGYDDYVSYAYTGGLNLGKITELVD